MRLAYLTPDWTPNGGIATYVRLASAALAATGDVVHVLHRDASDGAPPAAGVTLEQLSGFARADGPPRLDVDRAMEQIYAFRPELVHFHGLHHIELEQRVREEFPAIKTFHVYDYCPSGTKFHHALDRACTHRTSAACVPRQAYLRCTLSKRPSVWWSQFTATAALNAFNREYRRLIVASHYVKREALRTGYADDRVVVLPYFTTLPPVVSEPLPGHILFVGRLTREKGVELLCDALTLLRDGWTCTIVGDGLHGAALKQYAEERGLLGRLRFAGWLTGTALAEEFSHASVLALPSRWPEPFGIVGIEAMAHGRPVVAFRVGGIPDWLDTGVTGWAIEPHDVNAFAARLQWVLDHPQESRAVGARGRERVARDFTSEPHLAQLRSIYRDVTHRR